MPTFMRRVTVFKQLRQGFSQDGKNISGVVKIEKYGYNLNLCVNLLNLSKPSTGIYTIILCDCHGNAEFFDCDNLGGRFSCNSFLRIEDGFCCLLCHNSSSPSALAVAFYGDDNYSIKNILSLLLSRDRAKERSYNDELVTNRNYFDVELFRDDEEESSVFSSDNFICDSAPIPDTNESKKDDDISILQNDSQSSLNDKINAQNCGEDEKETQNETKTCAENFKKDNSLSLSKDEIENDDVTQENSDEKKSPLSSSKLAFYDKIKNELNFLMTNNEKEENLINNISYSDWVKVHYTDRDNYSDFEKNYYVVGIISDREKPLFICYGIPSSYATPAPESIRGYATFLPISKFELEGEGYWVIYQSADTGAVIKVKSA